MSVTLEQLNNAPVGSKLINTGFEECVTSSRTSGTVTHLIIDGGNYGLNAPTTIAILANPAVELVTGEPEPEEWES